MYLPLSDAVAEAVFQEVENYVSCRHITVTQFIVTRPIIYLCLTAEKWTGSRVVKRWWDQEGLDFEGMQTAAWEAERTEETDGTETVTY